MPFDITDYAKKDDVYPTGKGGYGSEPPPVKVRDYTGMTVPDKYAKVWERSGDYITRAANKAQVDPAIILSLVVPESGGDPTAVSMQETKFGNAYGGMQVMWPAAKDMGYDVNSDAEWRKMVMDNPQVGFDAGAKYIKLLLNRYKGNLRYAVAAYHDGMGTIDAQIKAGNGITRGKNGAWHEKKFFETYSNLRGTPHDLESFSFPVSDGLVRSSSGVPYVGTPGADFRWQAGQSRVLQKPSEKAFVEWKLGRSLRQKAEQKQYGPGWYKKLEDESGMLGVSDTDFINRAGENAERLNGIGESGFSDFLDAVAQGAVKSFVLGGVYLGAIGNRMGLGRGLLDASLGVTSWADDYFKVNQEGFWTGLGGAIGSSLPLFLGGALGANAASMIATRYGARLASVFGMSLAEGGAVIPAAQRLAIIAGKAADTSKKFGLSTKGIGFAAGQAVPEAIIEAGSTYAEAKNRGWTDEDALVAAHKTLGGNVPAVAIMDFPYALYGGNWFARLLGASITEGLQEIIQGNISEAALEDKDWSGVFDPRGKEMEFIYGAIVGGMLHSMNPAAYERELTKEEQEQVDTFVAKLDSQMDEVSNPVKKAEVGGIDVRSDMGVEAAERRVTLEEYAAGASDEKLEKDIQGRVDEIENMTRQMEGLDPETQGNAIEWLKGQILKQRDALSTLTHEQLVREVQRGVFGRKGVSKAQSAEDLRNLILDTANHASKKGSITKNEALHLILATGALLREDAASSDFLNELESVFPGVKKLREAYDAKKALEAARLAEEGKTSTPGSETDVDDRTDPRTGREEDRETTIQRLKLDLENNRHIVSNPDDYSDVAVEAAQLDIERDEAALVRLGVDPNVAPEETPGPAAGAEPATGAGPATGSAPVPKVLPSTPLLTGGAPAPLLPAPAKKEPVKKTLSAKKKPVKKKLPAKKTLAKKKTAPAKKTLVKKKRPKRLGSVVNWLNGEWARIDESQKHSPAEKNRLKQEAINEVLTSENPDVRHTVEEWLRDHVGVGVFDTTGPAAEDVQAAKKSLKAKAKAKKKENEYQTEGRRRKARAQEKKTAEEQKKREAEIRAEKKAIEEEKSKKKARFGKVKEPREPGEFTEPVDLGEPLTDKAGLERARAAEDELSKLLEEEKEKFYAGERGERTKPGIRRKRNGSLDYKLDQGVRRGRKSALTLTDETRYLPEGYEEMPTWSLRWTDPQGNKHEELFNSKSRALAFLEELEGGMLPTKAQARARIFAIEDALEDVRGRIRSYLNRAKPVGTVSSKEEARIIGMEEASAAARAEEGVEEGAVVEQGAPVDLYTGEQIGQHDVTARKTSGVKLADNEVLMYDLSTGGYTVVSLSSLAKFTEEEADLMSPEEAIEMITLMGLQDEEAGLVPGLSRADIESGAFPPKRINKDGTRQYSLDMILHAMGRDSILGQELTARQTTELVEANLDEAIRRTELAYQRQVALYRQKKRRIDSDLRNSDPAIRDRAMRDLKEIEARGREIAEFRKQLQKIKDQKQTSRQYLMGRLKRQKVLIERHSKLMKELDKLPSVPGSVERADAISAEINAIRDELARLTSIIEALNVPNGKLYDISSIFGMLFDMRALKRAFGGVYSKKWRKSLEYSPIRNAPSSQAMSDEHNAKVQAGRGKSAGRYLNEVYTDWVDADHMAKYVIEEHAGGSEISRALLERGLSPYHILRGSVKGWAAAYNYFLRNGVRDPKTGERIDGNMGIEEILKHHKISGNLSKFSQLNQYMKARRLLGLYDMDPKRFTGWTADEMQDQLRMWRGAVAEADADIIGAADKISQFMNATIKFSNKNGIHSDEEVLRITENPGGLASQGDAFYAPLYEAMDKEVTMGGDISRNAISGTKPLGTIDRNTAIMDPVDAAIRVSAQRINAAYMNNAKLRIAQALDLLGIDELGHEIDPRSSEGRTIITNRVKGALIKFGMSETDASQKIDAILSNSATADDIGVKIWIDSVDLADDMIAFFDDGKIRVYQAHPDLLASFSHETQGKDHPIWSLITKANEALKFGATRTPDFAVRNVIRDLGSAFVGASSMISNPADAALFLQNWSVMLFKTLTGKNFYDEHYRNWVMSGGGMSEFVSIGRSGAHQTARAIAARGKPLQTARSGSLSDIRLGMASFMDALTELSTRAETMTRLAVYRTRVKQLEAQHPGKASAIIREIAALDSRDATIDFARVGKKAAAINRISAFFTAGIGGSDKMVRSMFSPQSNTNSTMMRGFIGLTIPSLVLHYLNNDEEWYQNRATWEKNLFWMVKVGDRIIKWPKPFEYGLIFASLPERMYDWIAHNDPREAKALGEMFAQQVFGGTLDPGSAVLGAGGFFGAMVQTWVNKDAFRGEKIIKGSIENLKAPYQYTASTSNFARYLSKVLYSKNIEFSPAKIDFLVRGSFAGVGQYGLDLLSLPGYAKTVEPDVQPLSRKIPLVKSFTSDAEAAYGRYSEEFYELYSKTKEAAYTWNELADRRATNEERATELDRSGHYMIMHKFMYNAVAKSRALSATIEAITYDPDMSDDVKREKIRQIRQQRELFYRSMVTQFHESVSKARAASVQGAKKLRRQG